MTQVRCDNCNAVLEGAGPGMAVMEDLQSLADVLLEHCEMHKLEDPPPVLLNFILLPAEEHAITIELNNE